MHSRTTAREIIDDFAGTQLDYWVTGFGTGGTLKGVARVLAKELPDTRIVVCEPGRGDADQRRPPRRATPTVPPRPAHPAWKPHPMQGWSPDFIPRITGDAIDSGVISEIVCVSGPDALRCSRELATKEGIFVGITSGATFAGALQVCAKAPKGSNILCMLPDTGERYLSTPIVLTPRFESLGFKVRWVPMQSQTGRAGDLVAERRCPAGGPVGERHCGKKLLLIGHMDTVFEQSSSFQKYAIVPNSEGKIATGPGVADMKGGLVVMLAALRAMQEAGALDRTEIRIVLSGDEERVGNPIPLARHDLIDAARQSDVALEFEPSVRLNGQDTVSISRRSSTTWHIETTGVSGHSSQIFGDRLGYGAVYELARILDAFRKELPEDGLTCNAGLVLGGATAQINEDSTGGSATGKANVVAPTAIATGDLRTLNDEQTARVEAKMRAIVATHLAKTGATITFDESYPAMARTPAGEELLSEWNEASVALGFGPVLEGGPMTRGAGDISFALGNDGGDIPRGGHVEGGILDPHAIGGELFAAVVGYFDGGALFNGDGVAGRGGQIDGRPGAGDVEGYAVLLGQDSDAVGADLVGHIAIGGHPVGADDDGLDLALAHEAGCHVVAQDGGGDAVVHHLPGGEARALQERPRLIRVDVQLVAAFHGRADHSQGHAITAGGKGPGVAVGQHRLPEA
jgi:glutamate carboxypeptidase